MVAQVATDAALDRTFDYLIPSELEGRVAPGMRVRVSFGKRQIEGTVLGLVDDSDVPKLKPIIGLVDERPFITPELLKLAHWMAAYYFAPIEQAVNALLPAPVRRKGGAPARERLWVEVVPEGERTQPREALTSRQNEVLELIERGGDGFFSGICEQWRASPGLLRKIAALGFLRIVTRSEERNPLANRTYLPSQPWELSAEQEAALRVIMAGLAEEAPRPVLLHGVTGSGKTEVYLQAIAAVLESGRGAIVMVPEISLTPQTIQRFASRLGNRIAVLHSQLSDGERHDEWHRIRKGEASVVIGPRSAVFAPIEKLGIIIVDEEHEPSYKQEETPRYNARDVAVMRARLSGCAVVLGTATPSLESWRNARTGKYALACLTERAPGATPPNTMIVDMRSDGERYRMPQVFSRALVNAIRRRLQLGEQTILFLNRRGYAPVMTCPECQHTETCEECSLAMTYHLRDDILRCHLCGFYRPPPAICPNCGSSTIRQRGIGTQRVEVIAGKLFPRARIERMDADVTTRKHSHEEILARFRGRKIDILIGTQMIAKGLDFPNVTLVGVLNADASLFVPDFRASERTFQLIAQVAGRSGRGSVEGEVMVQTTSPAHPAIACARTEDFARFADGELRDREELGFPPFTRLVCITFRGMDAERVEAYARQFAAALGDGGDLFVAGEVTPAPICKVKNMHRFQMLARAENLRPLRSRLRHLLLHHPPPRNIRVSVDVDALNLM